MSASAYSYDAPPEDGREALARLQKVVQSGRSILGGGAGTGISAKFIEEGGADLLVIYNSGRYRMAGRGSLAGLMPYGDANAVVVDMAKEVIPVVHHTPVLAGVCASDPFRSIPRFLRQLKDLGFTGVQNFPTVGLIDGTFRQNLEETGMGYACEVELVREASKLGLLTTPYVFDPEQAKAMAEAGADVVVAHMGLTTKGSIGATTALTLDYCVERITNIATSARSAKSDIIVLIHGGPIAETDDVEYVMSRVNKDAADGLLVAGFYGASSLERLPVERALREEARKFKEVKLR